MSGGMPMPGGWTLSMTWLRMPGQTWFGASIGFLATWMGMMMAMMLPSLVPVLSSYRRAVGEPGKPQLGTLTALVGGGYFLVWAVYGAVAYALGVGLTAVELRWSAFARFAPAATGIVLLLAGCVQLTAWKASQLQRCWEVQACRGSVPAAARGALRHGLWLGVHCSLCCSGYMILLLVTGMMNLAAIAVVAAAITVERLAPRPEWAGRACGAVVMLTGAGLIARALGGP